MKPGQIVFKGKSKKGKEIIVRYPTKKDAAAMRKYMNVLSRERTFIRFQGEQLSLAEEKKYLNSFLKKMAKGQALKLMVFTSGKLVAISDISLEDKVSGHVGNFGLTVAKGFRNEGIGKLLMKLVLKEAKKNIKKLRIVSLGVFANNPVARRLYEKRFGFKEYACLKGGIKHRGKFIDHLLLCKIIK